MADQLERQLVERLNLTAAQQRDLPDVLAELDLPLEHVAEAKAPKDSAAYTTKGPAPFVCAECVNYQSATNESKSSSCDIVAGDISPKGSCKWWEHPEAEEPEAGDTAYEHVAVYNKQGD